MAQRPRKNRMLLFALLGAIVCMPLIFWALMAWQSPATVENPYWFVGSWQAPEGKPGNQITIEAPAGSPAAVSNATGKAVFTNFFETGAVRVSWAGTDVDPLVLHFTGGEAAGVPPYAAVRAIDAHNMQIRFSSDAAQARSPGFLNGEAAQLLIRWP